MSRRWLALRIEAPLMAFGGVAIDHLRPTRDFPSASMVVGLIANALGWKWTDHARHQALQDRLVLAARRDREGTALTDLQTVALGANDLGWRTVGPPEGRAGSSYAHRHRRFRDHHADAKVLAVIRLAPDEGAPSLDEVAEALDRPARPLYIGRKHCLPTRPLLDAGEARWVSGATAHEALEAVPGDGGPMRGQWPVGQGPETGDQVDRIIDLADLRNWRAGSHAGSRRAVEGRISPGTS